MKLSEIATKVCQINTANTPIFFKRKYSSIEAKYYFNANNILKQYSTEDSTDSCYPILHIFDFIDEWEFLNEDLNA